MPEKYRGELCQGLVETRKLYREIATSLQSPRLDRTGKPLTWGASLNSAIQKQPSSKPDTSSAEAKSRTRATSVLRWLSAALKWRNSGK